MTPRANRQIRSSLAEVCYAYQLLSLFLQVLMLVCLMVTKITCYRDCSQEDSLAELSDSSYGVQHHERVSVSSIEQHSLSKRQRSPYSYDNNLPWNCGSNVTWRDLGEMFFPRHILEVVCRDTVCWFGHYRCRPVYKTIKVLKMNQGHCRDTALPVSLRTDWLMADVDISVFCQCGR